MKKIYMVVWSIILIFITAGCLNGMTPSEKVEDMMNRYIRHDPEIVEELNTFMNKQDLNDSQKNRYKNIILDEYSTIKSEVKNESITGTTAKVELEIEVKDLYKAAKTAGEYLLDNTQEFYENGVYNEDKFIDYKLELMENNTDTIKYTLIIDLQQKDGSWTILDLENSILEKIHGIYNYESPK